MGKMGPAPAAALACLCAATVACLVDGAAATRTGGVVAFAAPRVPLGMRGARSRPGVCGLGMLYDDVVGDFKEGEKVKLKADTWFFHVSPKDFPGGTTISAGTTGTIKKIILTPDSLATPHRPIQVQFTEPRKWIAHMEKNELERA